MAVLPRRQVTALPRILIGNDRRISVLERRRPLTAVSVLPTEKATGQRVLLAHATGVWEVMWAGTQWIYLGGDELVGFTAGNAVTNVNTYPASPQGPSVTPPAAGTFDVWIEATHQHAFAGNLFTAAAVQQGGAANATGERAPVIPNGAVLPLGWWASGQAGIALTAAAVGVSFRAPNAGGINCTYSNRQIRLRPRTLT